MFGGPTVKAETVHVQLIRHVGWLIEGEGRVLEM